MEELVTCCSSPSLLLFDVAKPIILNTICFLYLTAWFCWNINGYPRKIQSQNMQTNTPQSQALLDIEPAVEVIYIHYFCIKIQTHTYRFVGEEYQWDILVMSKLC